MGLNKSTGQMYEWITHTWNTVKGRCYHDCTYCYMKRWGKQSAMRFDEKELKTDLGSGNFIFVGSSCDLFADDVPPEWIIRTLTHCESYPANTYLLQTKNPSAYSGYAVSVAALKHFALCITIETNRWYGDIMGNCPPPKQRAYDFSLIPVKEKYVTIEPILDFDLQEMVSLIKLCNPKQVNIGADSGNNNLTEPSYEKVMNLISELNKFTTVANKKNLNRLLHG